MPRIHTCNARRRAHAWRSLGNAVLQAWECYVDEIEDRIVHLAMHDLTEDRGDREYGSFPRRLFRGIDVKPGLVVIVEVLRSRRISIHTIPRDPGASNAGEELASLIRATKDFTIE